MVNALATHEHENKPSCIQNGKYLTKSQHFFPCQLMLIDKTHVRTLLVSQPHAMEENSTT